ncbi:hypothetical protein [Citrobacter braakii]|uniref:hypothetical protein n=1 Tax=Citrobacter braakii TaxID=57706 RepID=UPI0020B86F9F|nr:hypothetical protein [Citrobacter braakii]
MSVKRYELCHLGGGLYSMMEDSDGEFVRYEDHTLLEQKLTDMAVQLANAESKCRELAAELSAVDKIHNEAVFITDDHYEQCPPEVQKMIRSLAVLQIPAYDAFLAEVRAQGVESGINTVIAMMNHQHPATSQAIDILQTHAAQIRKGAAL